MSFNSIVTNQLINDNGKMTIDIFKNLKGPDDSLLVLNSNGKSNESITFNSPNGGMSFNSPNGGMFFKSDNIDILPFNKIKLNSNSIEIKSIKSIEIGNDTENIFFNFLKKSLDINFFSNENSSVNINTCEFNLKSYKNSSGIFINDNIQIVSDLNIKFSNNNLDIIDIDCKNNNVNVNGNMYISGKLYVNDGLIKYKSLENVLTSNSILFDLSNSSNKNWKIISQSENNNELGIYYSNNINTFEFKDNNNINLGLKCGSLSIENKKCIGNNFLKINNIFSIDKTSNVNINGNLNLNGKLNINNSIIFDEFGNFFIEKLNITQIFKYSVGINYKFINIQECIDYIEENEFYKIQPIFIEIYPNKIYNENIFITKPNINLIGKYLHVKINGSINVNLELNKDEIILENLLILSQSGNINSFNNIFKLNFNNLSFKLNENSGISINNCYNLNIKNTTIIANNNKCEFKINNANNTYIINSSLKVKSELNSKKIVIIESKLELCYNMKIISNGLIKFFRNDIIIEGLLAKLKNDVLFRNKTCLLNDCIISDNKSDGIIYPTLVLNYNFNYK